MIHGLLAPAGDRRYLRPMNDTNGATRQGERDVFFGDRLVREGQKAPLVRDVFRSVAGRYDLMNDLMSAGIHRLWKSAMVEALHLQPGQRLLDVAGGTGDIAFRVIEKVKRQACGWGGDPAIIICDLTPEMLSVGRDRAIDKGILSGMAWVCGDAERLPLPDRSVDAYSIAFGLRNVTRIEAALAEAYRVLRPGGQFLCLEFSQIALPFLDDLYQRYSTNVLPILGGLVAGDREAYSYLIESIRRFPPQEDLVDRIATAGLERVRYRNLSSGIAALHSAWRL
jgi:demethylmenaquinone methyltransferase/2-methoxy-6-polyprenyl-1,4-benzoquinol methylase